MMGGSQRKEAEPPPPQDGLKSSSPKGRSGAGSGRQVTAGSLQPSDGPQCGPQWLQARRPSWPLSSERDHCASVCPPRAGRSWKSAKISSNRGAFLTPAMARERPKPGRASEGQGHRGELGPVPASPRQTKDARGGSRGNRAASQGRGDLGLGRGPVLAGPFAHACESGPGSPGPGASFVTGALAGQEAAPD